MRVRTFALSLAALALSCTVASAGGLNLPKVESATLSNGIEVQMVQHPTVPIVAVEFWISAGSLDDPAGMEGLASLTAGALRKGAGEHDANSFADAVDFLGADFDASVSLDRTRIRINLLGRDLPAGLDLLADAILRPSLQEDEIVKLRDQMAESVTSNKENPRNVLSAYHRAHVFAGHPYGRPVNGSEASLPTISAATVRDFPRDKFVASRVQVTVVGDIEPDAVVELLESRFGAMQGSGEDFVRTVQAPPAPAADVLLVIKADTPQTWFRIGGLGPSWEDLDDFAATRIVQTVFGGRFTSWLNTALRIEAGLTYGAGYRIWRAGASGEATISSFTATATTSEAIDLALVQLTRLHEDGLSEADLASAKAYLRGQLPYDYETASAIAFRLAELRHYGIDRTHVDQLFEQIDAVTLDDCREVVERWFKSGDLTVTVIGVAGEITDTMAAYGKVTVRENSDPGFSATPEGGQSR